MLDTKACAWATRAPKSVSSVISTRCSSAAPGGHVWPRRAPDPDVPNVHHVVTWRREQVDQPGRQGLRRGGTSSAERSSRSRTASAAYSGRDGESQTADHGTPPILSGSTVIRSKRVGPPRLTGYDAEPSRALRETPRPPRGSGRRSHLRVRSQRTGVAEQLLYGNVSTRLDYGLLRHDRVERRKLRPPSAERCPLAQYDEGSLRRPRPLRVAADLLRKAATPSFAMPAPSRSPRKRSRRDDVTAPGPAARSREGAPDHGC